MERIEAEISFVMCVRAHTGSVGYRMLMQSLKYIINAYGLLVYTQYIYIKKATIASHINAECKKSRIDERTHGNRYWKIYTKLFVECSY